LSSSEDLFLFIYDSYVWDLDDDMISYLFEDSQPPLSSILEEYKDMAISEKSKDHSTKRKYIHIDELYRDSQMKGPLFSFSIPELVPYLILSS
jgi:hypothetical protein